MTNMKSRDYWRALAVVVLSIAGLALLLRKPSRPQEDQKASPPAGEGRELVLIPPKDLPAGWRLIPQRLMPPNPFCPWWRKNPQVFRGKDLQYLHASDRPTAPTEVWMAAYLKKAYMKDESIVMMAASTYPTPEVARADYALRSKENERELDPPLKLVGFSRFRENTLLWMLAELGSEEPNLHSGRDAFTRYFHSVTVPSDEANP